MPLFLLSSGMDTDVLFTLTGDIRYNSRALKQLDLLAGAGYRVIALGLGATPAEERFSNGVMCYTLQRPVGRGPAFFWRVHQLFKATVASYSARVYHASDLYTLPAQSRQAKQRGQKFVYDARERYPYVASTAGRPWVSWFWEILERISIRNADAVFTVSRSIASHMVASYSIDYPSVLYNVPPMQQVERTDLLRQRVQAPAETVIVLHQGKIQKDRGCSLLVEAMQHVQGAVLVFLGDGPLKNEITVLIEKYGLGEKVFVLDPVKPEELLPMTASADIGVSLLEDTCLNHRYALPNKLFEYLMAGTPVLTSALPEMENIVIDHEVGCVVPPENASEIASVLQSMIDAPEKRSVWSKNTRRVFETFNWEKASETFLRTYAKLLPATS